MPKIIVTNFVPTYCPHCGQPLYADDQAVLGGCSASCQVCGTIYQQADSQTLINAAAESGGDLECLLINERLIAVTGGL